MPYKDPEKAREARRQSDARKREQRIQEGWIDGRGRHGNHVRGENHRCWRKDGKSLSSEGYVLVRVPKGHHLRQKGGSAYEHQLVAEEMMGRRLNPDEIVHHKNHNKTDNRPENLTVLTRTQHMSEHMSKSTLIWLTPDERSWIDAECERTGESRPDVIRRLIQDAMKIPLPMLDGQRWEQIPTI